MPHIPRAICSADGLEMAIQQTGILVEMSASWGPYYKVYGDRFECPSCHMRVILPADKVLVEHYQSEYDRAQADKQARFIA